MPSYRRLACKLNYFQSIILMFAAVILIGAALLMLPISAQERTVTPFHEALFTATSAVCVTGLVVRDTASHWSAFGQAVLMVLIQIGGLGVITVGASFSLLSGRRISLSQRGRMQEAMSAPKVGGIVRLTGFVIRTSLMMEGIGALLLGLDSDTFYIYHVAAVMVDNLRRLLLGINLSDKAIMDFDFPGVGFPV